MDRLHRADRFFTFHPTSCEVTGDIWVTWEFDGGGGARVTQVVGRWVVVRERPLVVELLVVLTGDAARLVQQAVVPHSCKKKDQKVTR